MHYQQGIYWQLYTQLINSDGQRQYEEIIQPWLEEVTFEKIWLAEFANRQGSPYPDAEIEDLWRLYALSRVNDICLLRFQLPIDDIEPLSNSAWNGLNMTVGQYISMFTELGFHTNRFSKFHPFYHEIVHVEQSNDDNAPIEIIETLWDCLMLGNMLFSRAGVVVRGGEKYIRKDIAEKSTLYWTFRRKYKRCNDLSMGWGHNSQWRTSFRRDYFVNGHYYYHVDAYSNRRVDLTDKNVVFDVSQMGNATRLERIEFLRNRCFIHAEIESDKEFWPYYDFYEESE